MLKLWNKIGKEGEGLSSKKASLRNFVMFGVLKNIFFVIPTPCRGTGQAPAGTQQLFLKSAEKYYEAIQNGRSKSCPHSDF